ncbi:hypothetical protein CV657_04555 [Borreliella burgdorferi]|nr:hypothetical protein CV682_04375 [Borreliella burgdorferi]PRQ95137.1 hypothetical protein CV688_04780 [Borreliella burgdorferi]PRR02272.1 hypothetical protein CV665_04665 [Borreliella burgdorferi]PRR03457.1 hypothetical protein CV669_04375 [Borreliella burgdorferi]PRR07163.1 hypothetical protein CV675_04835 [Borreliella burgdorferi]
MFSTCRIFSNYLIFIDSYYYVYKYTASFYKTNIYTVNHAKETKMDFKREDNIGKYFKKIQKHLSQKTL